MGKDIKQGDVTKSGRQRDIKATILKQHCFQQYPVKFFSKQCCLVYDTVLAQCCAVVCWRKCCQR